MDTFSSQTVTGKKTFVNNVIVDGDLIINGLVDSTNLTNVLLTSVLMNKTQTLTGLKTFTSVTAPNVKLLECKDDCVLLNLLGNLTTNTARSSNGTVIVKGIKHFLDGLQLEGKLDSALINSMIFPGDLLLQGVEQTIRGETHFHNHVTFQNDVSISNLNQFNLTELYERVLLRVGNQTVRGHVEFSEEVYFNNLRVIGRVDGVDLTTDVAYTNRNFTLKSRKTFQNKIFINHLSTNEMNVQGFIDGVNLTELEAELVTLSGDKIIKGKKIFKNQVTFTGNWSIEGLIDGVNITELAMYAMRVDKSQVVSGKKV